MSRTEERPQFIFPIQGDVMVGQADGVLTDEGLQIRSLVKAANAQRITVNGVEAKREEAGIFSAKVILDGRVNRLEALDPDKNQGQTITVYNFQKAYHKYRFTVDDFIRGFEDIHLHRNEYSSIFENPYLKIFKDAHDKYGSKVHINAFYETGDGSFDLSQMTDRFRDEFTANAEWLSFSFHARREHPDLPYQDKSYDEVKKDCLLVTNELRRIVGSAALRNTTTLHWGGSSVYGTRALRALGYRALCAYLILCHGEDYYKGVYEDGQPIVSYHLSREQVEHAEHRCFWVDTEEDVVFAKLHMVLNAGDLTANRVEAFLDDLSARPTESGFIQMVIHEQHFYPDYVAYEPDYRQRIMMMADWMQRHGYTPASLSDIIEENEATVI